jgi:DNA-binding IclR family transcriptional regulator
MGEVFDLISHEKMSLSATEVARHIGISRSSAHDLLSSMAKVGLLRVAERTRYYLGERVVALRDVLVCTEDIQAATFPILERLRDWTGEAVQLVVGNSSGQLICVDQVDGCGPVQVSLPAAGSVIRPGPSAAGKVLAAFQDPAGYTGGWTVGDSGASSRDEMARMRATGLALDHGACVEHVCCIAAPILTGKDGAVAALAVVVPEHRFVPNTTRLARCLLQASQQVSSRLDDAKSHSVGTGARSATSGAPGADRREYRDHPRR